MEICGFIYTLFFFLKGDINMRKRNINKEILVFLIAICASFSFIFCNYTYKKNLEEARIKAKIERAKEEEKRAEENRIEPIPKGISNSEVLKYLKEFQKRAKNDKRYNKVIKNSKEYQSEVLNYCTIIQKH